MRIVFKFLFLLVCVQVLAQSEKKNIVSYVAFYTDSASFSSRDHYVQEDNKRYFYARINKPDEEIGVDIYLSDTIPFPKLTLLNTEGTIITDSVGFDADNNIIGFSFRLGEEPFLKNEFTINVADSAGKVFQKIRVPVIVTLLTTVTGLNESFDVFQEEEISVDLPGMNTWNIQADPVWRTNNEFDYKISKEVNSIRVSVRAHLLGKRKLRVPLRSIHPVLQANGTVGNMVADFEYSFNVKPNQIDFLNFDKDEIFFERHKLTNGEEIQMRNHPNLILKKTYRVEDTQEPGGKLVAEIFTRTILANGRVLCFIRPFSLHRVSEGYLYMKDGDKPRFVTNLNILERPRIEQIIVMRVNEDWSDKLYARAGEEVEIKVLGKGLLKSNVQLEGLVLKKDSISISDEVNVYHLKVPRDFNRKKSGFFLNNNVTAFDLQIKEYQEPRKFDFIKISYGDESTLLNNEKLDKPVLYEKLLKDIVLSFDNDQIDRGERFYGKQYLEVEVKIVGARGDLKESARREVVICPGEKSPRYSNYDRSDCSNSSISLNDILNNKTYNLEGYSQIFVSVKHTGGHYSNAGYNRSVKIILKRSVITDLQVSFPAGLLIKRFDQEGIGNLSGISIAAFVQVSFYDQLQVGKVKPYRFGGGFLAINAFNFSDNATVLRDVGIVAIASIYPINRSSRFSFPLHTGLGFLIKQNAWFFMFGPGIEVRF